MKDRFIGLAILLSLSSCSVFRPGSSGQAGAGTRESSSQTFITGISTEPGNAPPPETHARETRRAAAREKVPDAAPKAVDAAAFSNLQFKYSILINVPVELLTNRKLLEFIDSWYGARYQFGGNSRDGIDCSAFTCLLVSNVYKIGSLPRMSKDQYMSCIHIPKHQLREGDLVFFHTYGRGRNVTHVGVYLYNNHFVHASVSGVMISDLSEGYYAQRFIGGGRIPDLIDR